MKFQELFNLLHEDKIEKTKGQGYLCLLHDSGCVPSLHGDFDAVLMTAGLAYAMNERKEIEAVIRGAVVYLDKVRAEGGELI